MYSYDVQLLIDAGEIEAGGLEAAEFDAMQVAADQGASDSDIERAGALAQSNFIDAFGVTGTDMRYVPQPEHSDFSPSLDEFDSPYQGDWSPFNETSGLPPDEFNSPYQSPISITIPSGDNDNGFDLNPFNRGPLTDRIFGDETASQSILGFDIKTLLLLMLISRR